MRTKYFFLFAAMLLTSVCAFAQSENEPLVGDVNGDGVVDIADVVAVLKIMKDGGGTSGGPVVYYWYVGHENPMEMTAITNPIPGTGPETANAGPGWRTIGTTLPTYSQSNPLWNDDYPIITAQSKSIQYVALPSDQIKERNEITQGDITSDTWIINSTKKTLNGVEYTVWTSKFGKKTYESLLW